MSRHEREALHRSATVPGGREAQKTRMFIALLDDPHDASWRALAARLARRSGHLSVVAARNCAPDSSVT